jgi:hypothetical protein
MTEIVRIYGKLMHSDGTGAASRPWGGATIDVSYHGYSQTPTEQRPSDRTSIKTNPDGTWETWRWVNAQGDFQSYYSFKFPYDQPIKVYLPAGTPPEIEFSELAIASTPPSDPSYPSLIALINSLFAGGNFAGTADVIPLNPAIPELGTTVQSAISALNNKPAVAKLRDLTDVNMGTQPNSGIPIYNSATQIFNLESQLDGGNF